MKDQPGRSVHPNDRLLLEKLKGGDRRSIGRSDEVAADILKSPELFALAWKGLTNPDAVIRMRCADALEKAASVDPSLLSAFGESLLEIAEKTTQQEVQWHAALMIGRVLWSRESFGRVENILVRWIDTSPSRIVQVNALQALSDLSGRYEDFRHVFDRNLHWALEWGSPALKARARMLRKPWND